MNPLVSVDWLFENLKHPNLVILDASPSSNKSNLIAEYPNLKIKGARIFDAENVFVDENKEIKNMFPSEEKFTKECQQLGINSDSIIVVYDNLGIYMSPRVWWMFKTMGHDNVAVLDGGLSAWKNKGYPCEEFKQATFSKGNFRASFQPENIKDSTFMLKNIEEKQCLVLDARSYGRFSGELPEPREDMRSGHIPGSKNLPFSIVLENGTMKSKAALTKIFSDLHIENQELTFTCGSGVTACIILLASELVSKNKKSLYDGSWLEWGADTKFPVA